MTERIIAISPAEQYFSMTWQLGTRCNYDCMYCDSQWHDNFSGMLDIETMKQIWHNVVTKTQYLALPYKLSFTGGEPTVNRDFLPFVSWLRSNFNQQLFQVLVTTNGSASLNYYQRMLELVNNISFSVHSEHINEQDFFNTIVHLHNQRGRDRFVHVNIMDEYWNRDRIEIYVDLLNKHSISYSVNTIDYRHQTRSYPIMKGNLNFDI